MTVHASMNFLKSASNDITTGQMGNADFRLMAFQYVSGGHISRNGHHFFVSVVSKFGLSIARLVVKSSCFCVTSFPFFISAQNRIGTSSCSSTGEQSPLLSFKYFTKLCFLATMHDSLIRLYVFLPISVAGNWP